MEQICENCRFFCKLNLFARYVGTVGGIGCVSGWRVEKMHSKFQESCGCNVFNVLLTDSGIVKMRHYHMMYVSSLSQKKRRNMIMSRNKYPGYCYCCGEYVKPGFGHYEKTRGKNMYRQYGKWRIKCVKCASGRIVHDTDKEVLRVQNG